MIISPHAPMLPLILQAAVDLSQQIKPITTHRSGITCILTIPFKRTR